MEEKRITPKKGINISIPMQDSDQLETEKNLSE